MTVTVSTVVRYERVVGKVCRVTAVDRTDRVRDRPAGTNLKRAASIVTVRAVKRRNSCPVTTVNDSVTRVRTRPVRRGVSIRYVNTVVELVTCVTARVGVRAVTVRALGINYINIVTEVCRVLSAVRRIRSALAEQLAR
jgi:hypothetical protein